MRNKKLADSLIIILILCFAVVMYIKIYIYDSYYVDMLTFVIEAALVGGIADWFAITALFRKPLGFPYHTAIIPRNRDKIIKAISSAVEEELLNQQTLQNKIMEVNFTYMLFKFIDENTKKDGYIVRIIEKYCFRILENLDSNVIAIYIEKGIGKCLMEVDIEGLVDKTFKYATQNNRYVKPLEELIDYIIIKVQNTSTKVEIMEMIEKLIQENIENKKGVKKSLFRMAFDFAEASKSINIGEIAEAIQKEIGEMLLRLKDIEDPLHIQMIDRLSQRLENLNKVEEGVLMLEFWKTTIVENIKIREELSNIIDDIIIAIKFLIEKRMLISDNLSDSFKKDKDLILYLENISALIIWVRNQLFDYWETLKENETSKQKIESYIKGVIYRVIKSQHSLIGSIVEKSLGNLTDEALNSFIEEKAGNDLHWIRINGCIVGGAFGLIVFLFVNELYMPFITKFLQIP